MAEYYYFVSSLPALWSDKEATITYKEFMEAAENNLTNRDFEDLKRASFSVSNQERAKNQIVKDWEDFEFKLNETLTEERAKKLGLDDKAYKCRAIKDKTLEDKVKKIVEDEDPLHAERSLLALYFDFLDSHSVSSPFSTEALMIYALKLQIKERSKSFSEEKGREEFDLLYKNIEEDIFHKE